MLVQLPGFEACAVCFSGFIICGGVSWLMGSNQFLFGTLLQQVHSWRPSLSCCWSPGLEQSATGGHISAITEHLSQASEDSSVHRVIFEHTAIVTD